VSGPAAAEGDAFQLVLICTGNRFRSPLAEGQIRSLVGPAPIHVRSLGLAELGPVPPLPEALEEAGRFGLDLSGHRARALQGEDLSGADLVLGFERIHLATAVVEANAERDRTFTLPELVELLDELDPRGGGELVDRARRVVGLAADVRRGRGAAPVLPEVPDPWGGPPEVYRETAERVIELTRALGERVFGMTASPAGANQ
jgi:low molecular weight protein-tyrosine phosphatase